MTQHNTPAAAIRATDVVAGVDSSDTALDAQLWAAGTAHRRGVRLVLVHAAGAVVPAGRLSEATVSSVLREGLEYGQRLLSDAHDTVIERYPTLEVHTLLEPDRPDIVLTELGSKVALLVVGSHGSGRISSALLGSVSQRVAAHARCPVVVIPPHRLAVAADGGPVLVGVSRSPSGLHALRFAFTEAQSRGTKLIAVRAWGQVRFATAELPIDFDAWHKGEETEMDETLATLQKEFPDVPVDSRLIAGDVFNALEHSAAEAGLLVLGCRHHDEHWPSRLGPVAAYLLHRSPCPVAVVGS